MAPKIKFLTIVTQGPVYALSTQRKGFPGGLDSKESACNEGDLGLIPGLGRPVGGGHDHLL